MVEEWQLQHKLEQHMRFEKLEVWIESKDLAVTVYREMRQIKDFGFRDQITRSALSVPSNIAEGLERNSDKELARFLTISKASCGEFRTQTIIGKEIGYIDSETSDKWLENSARIGRMLGGFIKRVEGRSH